MPFWLPSSRSSVDVVHLQLRAALRFQALPVVFRGNADIAVVGRLGVLIRHLEEDQIGELLQIVAIAHAVIAQRGAEAPDLGNDRCGIHAASFLLFFFLPFSVSAFSALMRSSKYGSRLIIRVLRDKAAGERLFQNALPKGLGFLDFEFNISLHLVNHRHSRFYACNQLPLLRHRGEGKTHVGNAIFVERLLVVSRSKCPRDLILEKQVIVEILREAVGFANANCCCILIVASGNLQNCSLPPCLPLPNHCKHDSAGGMAFGRRILQSFE